MDGFIIIGNHSAITYKEIFPYIKDNKMWLGYKPLGGEMYFHITDEYKEEIVKTKKEGTGWVEIDGEVMARVTQACWFTNLEHSKRKAFIGLTKKYNPTDYPKYDNYDAIEVGRVEDIPKDYDGVMGVPISFLGKYNHNQFEILDARDYADDERLKKKSTYLIKDADGSINGKPTYARILIRFEILWIASGHSKTSMPKDVAELISADFEKKSKDNTGNGYAILNGTQLYHRILIRKVKDKEEEL